MEINNTKSNALICLAAGDTQSPLIHKAKSLGYIVVVIDKNNKAEGFKYADEKIYISTHDADSIIDQLKLLSKKFKWIGVLNRSSGPPAITAAKICRYFDIPGIPIASAETLVHKDKFRQSCHEKCIPSPDYVIYDASERHNIEVHKFPVVVKPALSIRGKSGITIVRCNEELNNSIRYAVETTINKKIIIEDYLEAPDLTLVSFVNKSKLFPVCFLEELNEENEDGTISPKGFRTFDVNINNWYSQAKDITSNIVSIFKIERSPLLVSFRPNLDGDLRIVEVHLDLGGQLVIDTLYPAALPFDFLELAVEMATENVNIPDEYDVRPTAIIYNSGGGLIKERGCQIFNADSNQSLDSKILSAKS